MIFGVPLLKDFHSLDLTFKKIVQELKIPAESIHIDDIYQKKNNIDQSQSPIFIKFQTYKNKIDFKQAAKYTMNTNNKFLYANELGFSKNNKIIFVDQLTDVNQNLLREAKQLRAHGFKYIWTVNGRILAKQNDNSNVIVIKSKNCIESLKSRNSTI